MRKSIRKRTIICVIMALILMASCVQGAVPSKPNKVKPGLSAKSKIRPSLKAPTFALPVGAVILLEVNLSEDNILDTVKQAIPSFLKGASSGTGDFAAMVKMAKLDDLYEAVKKIKAIRAVQFKTNETMDTTKMLIFFERQVPSSKGWDRIFYKPGIDGEGTQALAVYARGEEFMGIMMSPKKNQSIAFSTIGFLDVAKLFSWAGSIAAAFTALDDKEEQEQTKAGQ